MKAYKTVIKKCADFYLTKDVDKMQDYEVVCKSILGKYDRFNKKITTICNIENSSPSRKAVKRLNPHVGLLFYYTGVIKGSKIPFLIFIYLQAFLK